MKYILMHRELSVAVLYINDVSGTVYRVEDVIHPEHLPVGVNYHHLKEVACSPAGLQFFSHSTDC